MKGKKVKQEYTTKPLGGAGAEPAISAKIGGVSNTKVYKDVSKKGK